MNSKLLAAGIALCAFVTPIVAQNFPDVPENHWAYDALLVLKNDGLLIGYPDGLFKGQRPLSRYEFAVAINGMYMKLKQRLDGLSGKVDDLSSAAAGLKVPEPSGPGGPSISRSDLDAIKDRLEGLKGSIDAMKTWGNDIEALRKLMKEFEKDLAQLGVDVGQMQKDLASMDQRVKALENRKKNININGDFNFAGFAGHSLDHKQGVSWSGNPVGTDFSGNKVGFTEDLHFVNELGLNLNGDFGANDQVHVEGEFVASTLFPYEFSSYSMLAPGGRKDEGDMDFIVHHLNANWNAEFFGAPVSIMMGRVPYRSSNYFAYNRIDVDPYFSNERWDNGNWYFDGGVLGFKLGDTKLNVFGGKDSSRDSAKSASAWGYAVGRNGGTFAFPGRPGNQYDGAMEIMTHVGAEATYGWGKDNHVAAQYILLDGDPTTLSSNPVSNAVTFNRMSILGLDAQAAVGKNLTFYGAYANADLYYNDHVRQTDDNEAYDIGLEWKMSEKANLGAGYRYVGPNFSAPGSWGRLGYWTNSADIKGFAVWYSRDFNDQFGLNGFAVFGTGTDTVTNLSTGSKSLGLKDDDKINAWSFYLRFPLFKGWRSTIGWEGLNWDLSSRSDLSFAGGDVIENYYSLFLTREFSKTTLFRFGYQVSDYNNKTGFAAYNTPGNSDSLAKGGLFFTQLRIGF